MAEIESLPFGTTREGEPVRAFDLEEGGLRARVIEYGAVVVSLLAPDRDGRLEDVVLGYDDLVGYEQDDASLGAVVGRYANRIAHGRFELDGRIVGLGTNLGAHHLHGGYRGFDKVVWRGESVRENGAPALRLHYVSADGEEGYPGELRCAITFALTAEGTLRIRFEAHTSRPTPVNLSHHGYFNLAGAGNGDVLGHELWLAADHFTPVDASVIPTGELRAVEGTPFDFREPKPIGRDIERDDEQLRYGGGYDHNFALRGGGGELALAARVVEPRSGRMLEMHTSEPGVQLYTGNFLDGRRGKHGLRYGARHGLCLEAQHFPDSPNRPEFPSTILRPGEVYRQETCYRLSAAPGRPAS